MYIFLVKYLLLWGGMANESDLIVIIRYDFYRSIFQLGNIMTKRKLRGLAISSSMYWRVKTSYFLH